MYYSNFLCQKQSFTYFYFLYSALQWAIQIKCHLKLASVCSHIVQVSFHVSPIFT